MIYFISAGKHIKIGLATDVHARKRGLQTANPMQLNVVATFPGGFKTEAGFHEMLKEHRLNSGGTEWFRYHDDIKFLIRAIKENPDETNIYTLLRLGRQLRLRIKANRLARKGNNKLKCKIKNIQA